MNHELCVFASMMQLCILLIITQGQNSAHTHSHFRDSTMKVSHVCCNYMFITHPVWTEDVFELDDSVIHKLLNSI